MEIELLDVPEAGELHIKALRLKNKVKLDYKTDKHASFTVKDDEKVHNVMYFSEKSGDKRWQCDCKWYTLQNKPCSHIYAVCLALKDKKVDI
ncbi:MAG: SWIM zinc finger family protein [Candidatus Parvarchaeota archaeon]|nr:SWIM zinc finger domain-containing protein [Candidatus Parvarchaeota archaeon]